MLLFMKCPICKQAGKISCRRRLLIHNSWPSSISEKASSIYVKGMPDLFGLPILFVKRHLLITLEQLYRVMLTG